MLGWYGDDFTGATDTLAVVAQAGLRSMLFMGVPDEATLAAAGTLDAVGIAGAARRPMPRGAHFSSEVLSSYCATRPALQDMLDV